jgi:hypothetical protein
MPWIMAFATKIITDNIKEKGLSIVEVLWIIQLAVFTVTYLKKSKTTGWQS